MAVVHREELQKYCRLDDVDSIDLAYELSRMIERRLTLKGVVDTPANHDSLRLAIMAMTLHELDHPGEKYPQGIQDMINELKMARHGV